VPKSGFDEPKMLKPTATALSRDRFLLSVCLFAFVLRICIMFAATTYRVVNDDTDHFGFGWEMGRVARSLVNGDGFSSPLPLPTGPTAIVGPGYPLLLALVFKVFGIYSTASAVAIRIIQCLFSSLTCLFIYLGGRDSVGESSGKIAALAWSVFPLNIFFTVTKVWETSITAFLVALLFWLMLRLPSSLSITRWTMTGALLGIAALVNTSLVVLIVPFGVSALWRNRLRAFLPALAGAITCLALVSPWIIRNHMQFGKFMLRSNFPLEFRVGNNELSYGQKVESLHPSNTPSINRHWQSIGESRFMAEEQESNARFLGSHLSWFVRDTLNRIVNYWTGGWVRTTIDSPNSWPMIIATSILSLAGIFGIVRMYSSHTRAAPMFLGCLLIYPLVYYLTTTQPRFYHAITPLIILSGSYWLIGCKERILPTRNLETRFPNAHKNREARTL
jgi:4-amino-4-deoxy-L-arabinose transferase-like glycosyltransferase